MRMGPCVRRMPVGFKFVLQLTIVQYYEACIADNRVECSRQKESNMGDDLGKPETQSLGQQSEPNAKAQSIVPSHLPEILWRLTPSRLHSMRTYTRNFTSELKSWLRLHVPCRSAAMSLLKMRL